MSQKKKNTANNDQNRTIVIAVIAIAVVAAVVFIFLSNNNDIGNTDVDYGTLTQERTDDGGFILGDPDAPITVVEFADFLCPHCQTYKPEMEQVIEALVTTGKARFEFRMLPISESSSFVFQVAECTDQMIDNGFWVGHDEIFKLVSRGTQADDVGRELSERLGFNYADLLECTEDADQWQTDERLAGTAGVSSTPTIRIRYGDGSLEPIPNFESGGPNFGVIRTIVEAASVSG